MSDTREEILLAALTKLVGMIDTLHIVYPKRVTQVTQFMRDTDAYKTAKNILASANKEWMA